MFSFSGGVYVLNPKILHTEGKHRTTCQSEPWSPAADGQTCRARLGSPPSHPALRSTARQALERRGGCGDLSGHFQTPTNLRAAGEGFSVGHF